jgi:hypothetical protein
LARGTVTQCLVEAPVVIELKVSSDAAACLAYLRAYQNVAEARHSIAA